MTTTEENVIAHYSNGALLGAIRAGRDVLRAISDATPVDQLAGVDEFHIGGRVATELICRQLELAPGLRVLDVGCGLGGSARFMAATYGVVVEGVDLTPDYIAVGNALTEAVGLGDKVHLTEGSALALPKGDRAFDRVTMFHVGMNIPTKAAVFCELARVLRPGGLLAVYDVMRVGDQPIDFPVAWARDESTSFVEPVVAYRAGLNAAGFDVMAESPQTELGLEFFAKMRARMAQAGPPPLGLHLLMGPDAG